MSDRCRSLKCGSSGWGYWWLRRLLKKSLKRWVRVGGVPYEYVCGGREIRVAAV